MSRMQLRWSIIGMLVGLLVLAASMAFAQSTGFTVTSVSPSTINPTSGQTATITYTVPTTANYRVYVVNSSGAYVVGINSYTNVPAGTRQTWWNGKNYQNAIVPNGTYTVVIEGKTTAGATLASGRATVIVGTTTSGGGTTTPPPTTTYAITVTSITNSTFDPSTGQTTTVNYTVPVNLSTLTNTVVNSAGATVRTLGTYSGTTAKSYVAPWNGKSDAGAIVPNGIYTVKMTGKAASNGAAVTGSATVTVKSSTTTPPPTTYAFAITGITPATIDPNAGATATITYTVPTTATVRVFVRNSTGTTVRTISTTSNVTAGTKTAQWNGKNDAGAIVTNGTYAVVVDGTVSGATTAITPATGNVNVSVATSGGGTTPPPPTTTGGSEVGYPVESKTAFNWEGWRYGAAGNKFGAAFTAAKSATVTSMAMEWKTQGSYGAGNYGYYDLTVVPSDSHGLPDTSRVLATQANFHPLNGGQPKDGWQIFDALDHSFSVTAGQRYWMVISARSVSSGNYSCPNTCSARAIKFVDTNLSTQEGYVVADYGQQGSAWRGWISGDGGFPASWKSGASNTTHCTQRGAIMVKFSDGTSQGQAGYWGSGGSGSGYDRIYSGMSVGEQILWNRPGVTVDRVSFFVGKVGTPSAALTWKIQNVTTGATLASGSIAATSVLSEANRIDIGLSPTISLAQGQTYRVSLSSTTSSSAAYRFFGACYDSGTTSTEASRYAAFTGATGSQTTLQYSTNGTTWTNGGGGRSGYAFDMPFSLHAL